VSVSEQTDGRRQRADVSRRRIAEAMLELARAGNIAPSADQVAERAGVGRRTVFRLFDDMDGVYSEMHAIMSARLMPVFAKPLKGATWRERLDEIIERRARLFEDMLPVRIAADAHRHRSPFLQKGHRRLTRMQRDTLKAVLPANIDAEKLEALDLAMSVEAWRRLRLEQGLSPKASVAVLKKLAKALLP
jgi:AcrR family transcriptional regulator